MKKFLLLALVILAVVLGYSLAKSTEQDKTSPKVSEKVKLPILRVGLVADSEDENDLLTKALNQMKGTGVNFVIGLGDWTSVGTVDQLEAAKRAFDKSSLVYYLTPGDHDLWDSRNRGEEALTNYRQVFGDPSQSFTKNGVQFVILDNSDIYSGISEQGWRLLDSLGVTKVTKESKEPKEPNLSKTFGSFGFSVASDSSKLTFVFAHKTPFHPQSAHVMGENNAEVSRQARKLVDLLEEKKVDVFFSGDLHFFARFNSPANVVKMTTIGAVGSERNFQGPRFAILTVFSDYSWEVDDVEIQ
ncbi:hypothetical protein A3A60_01420 [Candidatus Curtissbacteria bacterium RIFCSPLOWO2_01_FULL_42_26]|uniref:Calcineurin-like phosphoesterase domain-containing protein n=1 Tax=Candidatus Curtissbacteria bacterium RIFCSPLOWO2_01_FULL_42_26 TaxID=1797729 RepID=A0A1F5HY93_9BACT|nr:MAG: hypothetical protein A3A60_01420 [Candidatus Curtissbacteria bacterium RIFCSPLOWO2_01_FULL_42_26]